MNDSARAEFCGNHSGFILAVLVPLPRAVSAAEVYLPIVMPITGFLSVEGASQRNGAVMAIEDAPEGVTVRYEIFDTGTSATGAATALERALNSGNAVAVPSTVFGTEMVAMAPDRTRIQGAAADHFGPRPS